MKINFAFRCFLISTTFFLLTSSLSNAAEVIFLGNETSSSSQPNQSFTYKQRLKDLVNFTGDRKYTADRSGIISGRFSQQVDVTDIKGKKASSTYEDDNVNYLTEMNVNIFERMFADYQFEGQMFLRKTDNSRIESRRDVRLKQLNLKLMNDKYLYEFGDFYSDFSSFVMGSSLEGFNAELSPSENFTFKAVTARSKQADITANAFQRNVFGAKTDTFLFQDSEMFSLFRLGLQGVTVQDDSSTIKFSSSAVDLQNTVASIDGEARFRNGASLAFELARSIYNADKDDVTSDQNAGTAFKLQPAYNWKNKINFRYLYYYVQPKFYTDLGSASTDKIQHQLTADLKVNDKTSVSISRNLYWDHLDGSTATKRTINDEKYLTIMMRPSETRKQLSVRTYMSYLDRKSDELANAAEATTTTYGISLSDRIRETTISTFYEMRLFDDKANGTSTEKFHRFGVNFSRDIMIMARRLYLSASYNSDIRDPNSDSNVAVGNGFSLSGQYDWSKNLKASFGHNLQYSNGLGPNENNGTNRSFIEFMYKIPQMKTGQLSLRGEVNDFQYEDHSSDYREHRLILKFSSNF